ncbi:MAG: beta-galactosidase [Phycisphaerales bacterium]|nr:beta-galactosidase [Phycisphaerales bacterium]
MIESLHYGVCYFPEHWPESSVDDDLSRIRDAGLDYVRIGEGAWSYFEPAEGQYCFDLFDKVIDACQQRGLKVVFGTPTYTGPAWIGQKYPEVYRWDFNRTPMKHGGRRNYTYTSPKYLDLCDRIVRALATHYAKAKPILAWQIDNEFNNAMGVSYSPTDTLAFRAWLQARYKSLDALNSAWGTRFWSQTYDAWEQIDLPSAVPAYNNPTKLLDESRFISDTVVAFCRRQADILRAANPRWRLTHNALFENIDGPALVKEIDFWSHDQYPQFWSEWTGYNFPLIQSRSLGFPFAVQEQQAGPGGQMTYLHATPRPGQMRLWSYQSFAHGAKNLGYFCWKTCPFGSEQHWHGLLDADGKNTRRLGEAKQVGEEIRTLPKDVWDAPVDRGVAVLRDYDNEINQNRINTYVKAEWEPKVWTAVCGHAHLSVDMTWTGSDWTGYKVLVASHLRIVDATLAQKYDAFVRAGGTLVLGAQSATKDRNLHMVKATAPGVLRKLAGIEVEDWSNEANGQSFTAQTANGPIVLNGFVERLKLRGAESIAHWDRTDPLLADAPAITLHEVGKGRVIYVGGYANEAAVTKILDLVRQYVDLPTLASASAEVEVLRRGSGRFVYTWLLNHSGEWQYIEGLPNGRELIDEKVIDGKIKLKPYGVAIVQSRRRGA